MSEIRILPDKTLSEKIEYLMNSLKIAKKTELIRYLIHRQYERSKEVESKK